MRHVLGMLIPRSVSRIAAQPSRVISAALGHAAAMAAKACQSIRLDFQSGMQRGAVGQITQAGGCGALVEQGGWAVAVRDVEDRRRFAQIGAKQFMQWHVECVGD